MIKTGLKVNSVLDREPSLPILSKIVLKPFKNIKYTFFI